MLGRVSFVMWRWRQPDEMQKSICMQMEYAYGFAHTIYFSVVTVYKKTDFDSKVL